MGRVRAGAPLAPAAPAPAFFLAAAAAAAAEERLVDDSFTLEPAVPGGRGGGGAGVDLRMGDARRVTASRFWEELG